MSPRSVALVAVFSVVASAQTLEAPALTDAEKKKLDAGEMVLRDKKPTDNKGVAAISMGVIDATTAEQRGVRGIDDGVDLLGRDVAPRELDAFKGLGGLHSGS